MELDRVLLVLQALNEEGAEYLLVGAAALNLHGIIRATEDIDLFIRATPENVERIRRALRRVWADDEIDQIRAEELAGAYPVVRYGPPGEDFVVDLIANLGTEVHYDDLGAQTLSIEGVDVHVATPEALYRMKKDTLRPIDRADAAALKETFDVGDD